MYNLLRCVLYNCLKLLIIPCIVIIVVFIGNKRVVSQQLPQYTIYMQNNFLINPAISGIENFIDVRASIRNQWLGIKGAPKSYYLTAQGPIGYDSDNSRRSGVGGIIMYDQTGASIRFSLSGAYSYHLAINDSLKLALGIIGGFTQYRIDKSKLDPDDPDDAILNFSQLSQFIPDLGLGAWLYTDNFFVGASVQQIIHPQVTFGISNNVNHSVYGNSIFLTSGYRFYYSDISITPSFLVRFDRANKVLTLDLNVKAMYQDLAWIGVSYRRSDSFSILAGIHVSTLFNIAYAYDYGINKLASYNKGSHEIILGFQLNNVDNIRCPRNVW
ncbi:MAG: PorP/SprF family type IX secretion system membrane protein [Solitalea-like symbiont of Acarus siro]